MRVSEVMAQLLLNRKIQSISEATEFLSQSPKSTQGFPDTVLQAGTDLIQKHIDQGSLIFIVGDYDVDGMTSTSLFLSVLNETEAKVKFFIPHRFNDGYGLNKDLIQKVIDLKAGLLITLDCGITQCEEITFLKDNSETDVMILDHHQIPSPMPRMDVLIHPKQLEESHPCWHLCTAGIAYQFLRYFCKVKGLSVPEPKLLELAALGTIADIVPLVGENRRLTKLGLQCLSQRKNFGLRQLLETSKCDKPFISARDVGFVIAPRLNAAGRLTHAKTGVDLLMASNLKDAEKIALELETLNQKRREIGDRMFKEAQKMIQADPSVLEPPVLILSSPLWHAGVIGIIASRLVNAYGRPTILIAEDDAIGRASARSVAKVNIYELIFQVKDQLLKFGGHHQAAGFSVAKETIPSLMLAIRERAVETIAMDDLGECITLEMALFPQDINLKLVREIEKMSPFGMGNPAPIFYTNQLKAIEFKTVGDGSHLKVKLSALDDSKQFDAIGFGLAEKLPVLYEDSIELAFTLEVNNWMGVETAQLVLVDIKANSKGQT